MESLPKAMSYTCVKPPAAGGVSVRRDDGGQLALLEKAIRRRADAHLERAGDRLVALLAGRELHGHDARLRVGFFPVAGGLRKDAFAHGVGPGVVDPGDVVGLE